jgi:uncharacterized protein YceK
MRAIVVILAVTGISGCAVPFSGPSNDERKAPCDRLAARAIQTGSFEEAKNLSAQASECYARAQSS